MSASDEYLWPTQVRDAQAEGSAKAIANWLIAARAQAIHHRNVMEWAAANDGAFPKRDEAVREAREEVMVLCRGLGRWAAVSSSELSSSASWRPGWLDLADWERDLLA
mgnify:CR=1 FL=1